MFPLNVPRCWSARHAAAAIQKIAGVLRESLILTVLLSASLPAFAQVTFDAASNATPVTASNTNPVVVTWNHIVGLSKKPYLVVGVSIDRSGTAPTVTSVVFGSEAGGPQQAMTNISAVNNGTAVRAELWGVANPTPGTHQITVTVANPGGVTIAVVAGAKSFFNVFQTAATGTAVSATGTSLTPAVAVTNGAFDYVVDTVAYNGNAALTAGGGQTNTYNITSGAPAFSGAGSARTGANNVTMSWTATGIAQAWATTAVALQSATPQILFDSASSLRFSANAGATFTGSWNHTMTNAANGYLVVALSIDRGGNTATGSVRYGTEVGGPNVAMTSLGAAVNNGTSVRVELYGLRAPASGTHQITATVTRGGGTINVIAGAQSFSNVDQSASTGTYVTNTGNTVTPTVNVTNSAYDYVVDAVAFNGNNALTENGTQQSRYAINTATGSNFAGAGSGSRGYVNTTMSWTAAAAQNWAIAAIPLHQVSVGLRKTASADVIRLGDTVTYTLVATNYSDVAVNGVSITDAIPAGATFVSQTGCSGSGPVTCNAGTLAANTASSTFTITVVPNSAGTISNVATITWTGAANPNSSETVNIVAQGKVCATPGKDGAGGTLAGIKNDYWPGSASAAAGATTVTLGARVAGAGGNTITAGDLLVVMQMQDAAFDTTNDETYGEGTGSTKATGTGSGAATTLNNAGRWEYAIATNAIGIGGGALTLQGGGTGGGLLYSYTNQTFATTTTQGQRTFQVIRVPQYTTATLGSTLTALPWNGSTGGVLAIDVAGTITLGSATVSVNGLGFRGGAGVRLTGSAGFAATDFRTPAPDSATAPTINMTNGSKGEGITGTPRYLYHNGATIGAPGTNAALDTGVEGFAGGSYGRGAPGNSGGGSTDGDTANNQDNSGGGGGGNGGFGGAGGFGWACQCPSGGQGGGGISPSLTRITMGGGGGSGTTNNGSAADATGAVLADSGGPNAANANGYYSSGANGGGVIIIRALQATGTATLTANGLTAANVGRDGGGGGGAGGSVLFTTQIGALTGLTIQAKGGTGGGAWLQQAPGGDPGERHGPGGGGGGGYVLLSSAAASVDVSGGTNGLTTTALDEYGAQPGTLGVTQFIAGNNVLPGGDGASCAVADLAVTDSAPGTPVGWSSNITFTQTVVNNGPSPADSVVYTTSVPAATTFQSISVPAGWTCITPAIGGTGNITCTRPTLTQANGTQTFNLAVQTVLGTPDGFLVANTNSVSSLTPDSNTANNTAGASNPVALFADMSVTLTNNATTATTAGSNVTFTSVAKNVGPSAATGATWSMPIPANMSFQSMPAPPAGWTCITPALNATAGTISCSTAGTVAPNASASFLPVFKVLAGTAAGTVITGTANTDATNDGDDWNNTASSSFTVRGAAGYDMVATMSASPDPVSPASNVTFTSVVTNNGPASAPVTGAGVQWVMNVPANANFQSIGTVPAGWSCATPAVGATSGTITCTYQVAGVNQAFTTATTSTFNPVFQVNASTATGTTITGSATVNINGVTTGDNVPANNSASDSVKVASATNADVQIVKTVSPNSIGNGQLTNYTLAVTNNGPATATNVTFSDLIPASLTYQSHAASGNTMNCSYSSGTTTITCSVGTLPVGNTITVTFIVQAQNTGTIPNTASITSADQTDPVPANNSSTANLNVFAITLVKMRKLDATQDKSKVLVTWETSFESDNLGFDLYREIDGVRTKINKKLIAGSALRSKKNDDHAGYSYRFRDKLPSANAFAQYYLEDVDLNGTRTMHGPVSPIFGAVPDVPDSPSLAGLGANGSILQSPAGVGVQQPIALPAPTQQTAKTQFDLAGDAGLKIYVSQEGWYRVTRAEMTAAGFDLGNNDKKPTLYTSGIEIPMLVDAGGIEFYGLPIDTESTGARTYWLAASGKGNGSRISTPKTKGGDPVAGSVPFTYGRKERSIHFAALTNNGDATNFFGQVIMPFPSTQELLIGALDPSYAGNASMDITIQGATAGIHHIVDLTINDHDLGTVSFDSQDQRTFTLTFPQSFLVNGSNTLTMTALNDWVDISVLADTRITYQHLLRADNGELEVTVPGQRAVTVSGFTPSSKVRAIDVTDPMKPVELTTTVSGDSATFATDDSGQRTVLVFETARVLAAPELAVNRPSSWNDGKSGADLLIISNSTFGSAASALATARQRDGISTAVVDVDDVYDEMSFGVRGPEAIRSFLQSATKWKKAPKWVLLLGDASFDPRNYLALGAFDFVPSVTVPTVYLKTTSDDALTDFDGDGIADIPVGRIPARTLADATLVANRIASRGTPTGAWASSALFIADAPVGFDFAAAAQDAAHLLPASITPRFVVDANITSPLNDGALIADYIGHGSTEIWGTNGLLGTNDALALTNGSRLPFVIAMTCLTGAFHDVYTTSIAEGFLFAPNGGAIAVWGSSTLTEPDQQALMNNELMRQLFTPGITIGEAARRAKFATTTRDIRTSWILFGDPSMKLR
ncbi:MAG TPA: C25 family cysteine peptidase [Thermoanaerobaculia bacterium]|nr:C25 family cysteine peptidase [Thermoanaerobaculia bacterium]